MIVLPETTRLPVTAKSPEIVPPVVLKTVLSTSSKTVLFASTKIDARPSRPAMVNVSVASASVPEPVSEATDKLVAIETPVLDAEVKRPSASTVKTAILEEPPYVPATTPVSERSTVRVTLDDHQKKHYQLHHQQDRCHELFLM